jgi:hypothetical protein
VGPRSAPPISIEVATALRAAGIAWHPEPGDRFTLPDRGLDDRVFVLSDMVIDIHELPGGPVIGFNGTVEWALDSVWLDEALWLPREDQLRELLGGTFRSLTFDESGWVVTCEVDGEPVVVRALTAATAYAGALLTVLGASDS